MAFMREPENESHVGVGKIWRYSIFKFTKSWFLEPHKQANFMLKRVQIKIDDLNNCTMDYLIQYKCYFIEFEKWIRLKTTPKQKIVQALWNDWTTTVYNGLTLSAIKSSRINCCYFVYFSDGPPNYSRVRK